MAYQRKVRVPCFAVDRQMQPINHVFVKNYELSVQIEQDMQSPYAQNITAPDRTGRGEGPVYLSCRCVLLQILQPRLDEPH